MSDRHQLAVLCISLAPSAPAALSAGLCGQQAAGQTLYLIGHNSELALLRVWTLLQYIVDESKELLHDCILPHVIIARLHLQPMSRLSGYSCQVATTEAGTLLMGGIG